MHKITIAPKNFHRAGKKTLIVFTITRMRCKNKQFVFWVTVYDSLRSTRAKAADIGKTCEENEAML